MKFRSLIVAAILLAAGCIPPQTSVIQQPPADQQSPVLSDTPKPTITKNRDRDISECERESAFAGAGDKRKAFANCMKAKGY